MIDRIYCGISADILVRRRHFKILAPLGSSAENIAITLSTLAPDARLVESHAVKDHLRMVFVTETIETEEVSGG